MQDIHPSVWLAPSAQVFGRIIIAEMFSSPQHQTLSKQEQLGGMAGLGKNKGGLGMMKSMMGR